MKKQACKKSNSNVTVTLSNPMNQKSIQQNQTRQALVAALAEELTQPARLTAERVALRAGVNKALLYRYFGGLPGLLIAYAESDGFMPKGDELRALLPADVHLMDARARFVACIQSYISALRRRPATVQILLRLHLLDAEVVEALQSGRRRAIDEIREIFGPVDPSFEVDVELSFSLLISGICQVLGHRHASWMGEEVDIETLALRLSATVRSLVSPPRGYIDAKTKKP